ncbi:hypothetical protein D9M70_599820 [compost metagenome]
MQGRGNVLQGAAGVQVGSPPYSQAGAGGQYVVVAVACGAQGALGLAVQGDAAFALGGGLAPAALAFDQLAHGALAIAHHLGRAADGGCDNLIVDHHYPQVEA